MKHSECWRRLMFKAFQKLITSLQLVTLKKWVINTYRCNTRNCSAKFLRLSSNRRAKNLYAAQIMCFKGSSGICIKVCTSHLLTEMVSLVGREILVRQITVQHEEGHQNLICRVVWELLRLMHFILASDRRCCHTQTEGLLLKSGAEKRNFQPLLEEHTFLNGCLAWEISQETSCVSALTGQEYAVIYM